MGCGTSEQNIENVILPSNDRYQRKQLIGVGHHGRVYRSYYHLDKKQYAEKIIDQFRTSIDIKKLQYLSAELITKLKRLRHQKIITYFQVDFNEREISIFMELAKEGTLKKYIQKNGELPESFVANIVEKILEALDYLHNAGIIHKDLKTSNILMMPKDQIKLSDYGIAEVYDERLSENGNKGVNKQYMDYYRGDSLPYMAPEVIKNIEIIDKSDVWSLGCVVIEMITGKIPWENIGNFQQTFKILSSGNIPPLPKNISKQCNSFLECCLAVIPTQRLTIRELLQHKFIRMHSKNQQLYFQEIELIDNRKKTIEKIDRSNKTPIEKVTQLKLKQQKITHKQDQNISAENKNPSRSKDYRFPRNEKISKQLDNNMAKIRQALTSIDSKAQPKPTEPISNEQIHPQVQDVHTVMLNNKVVKLQPNHYKNKNYSRAYTEENEWTTPVRQKQVYPHPAKLSMQIGIQRDKQNSDMIKKRSLSYFEDSIDSQLKVNNLRMQTQPNYHDYPDKQYFKKPLKLLKKKLRESKEYSDFNRKIGYDGNKSSTRQQLTKLQEKDDDILTSRLRIYTETRQQKVIDTEFARAERDRYLNQQKLLRRQREEEKNRWEEQLKKGAEILKKEFTKYYYPSFIH